jgi:hypothetical protein
VSAIGLSYSGGSAKSAGEVELKRGEGKEWSFYKNNNKYDKALKRPIGLLTKNSF